MGCNIIQFKLAQVRIHFELLFSRYPWTLVRPQYSPPEIWSRLHNPLGLSQGLKSSSTGPQFPVKAAVIAMPLQAKTDEMVQSPTHKNCYVFYGVQYVRYHELGQTI